MSEAPTLPADHRTIQHRCKELLTDLGLLGRPFTVDDVARALEHRTGRPIRILPMDHIPGGAYGLWISTDTEDLVFYVRDAQPLQREVIILHELVHISLCHPGVHLSAEQLRTALPGLDEDLINEILERSSYDQEHEYMAEAMARTLARMSRTTQNAAAPATPEARFTRSLL